MITGFLVYETHTHTHTLTSQSSLAVTYSFKSKDSLAWNRYQGLKTAPRLIDYDLAGPETDATTVDSRLLQRDTQRKTP